MKHKKKVSPANRIKNSIKDYFTFTKSERRGIRALLLMLIALFGFLYYTHFITPPPSKIDIASFENEIKQFEASLVPKKEFVAGVTDTSSTFVSTEREMPATLFTFNPNNLPDEQWKKLGVSERIVKTIKNYESKGGHFRKKEDLQKMYSMPADLYNRLAPYIEFAAADTVTRKFNNDHPFVKAKEEARKNLMVDINIADETELATLPMIGSGRAKSIIGYRTKLHGYANKEQLHEVYGMPDSVYNLIADHVEVKAKTIEQININTNDASQIRHPYISFQLAKMIATYHTAHGDFKDIAEIKKLPLVDADLYAKLAPYLTIR